MKIASTLNRNTNNTNFKGTSTIAKYSPEIQSAITSSIKESFLEVLPEIKPKESKGLFSNVSKNIKKYTDPISNKITDGIAWFIGKTSNTKVSKSLVEGLNRFKKPSARMADLASVAITFFYVNNTRKSKKIDEERKMPLMVNNIAVTVVSSSMAAIIDKASDALLDRVKGAFYQQKGSEVLESVAKKAPEVLEKGEKGVQQLAKDILNSREFKKGVRDYTKRVEKAKSLTIFSFTVRFLVTVLMVPVAGKIVAIIKEKSANKFQKQNTQPKINNDTKVQKTTSSEAQKGEDRDDDDDKDDD